MGETAVRACLPSQPPRPAQTEALFGGDPRADLAGHARAVLLIGRDAPLIREAIAGSGVAIEDCASLEQAVARAQRLARPGQAVLLSPACASFDMFRSYKHRGEVFARAVRECAEQAGQPLEIAC